MSECIYQVGDWVEVATGKGIQAERPDAVKDWSPADTRSHRIKPILNDVNFPSIPALIYDTHDGDGISICFPQKPAGLFTHTGKLSYILKTERVKWELADYHQDKIDIWTTDTNSFIKHYHKKLNCPGCYCPICQKILEKLSYE